MHREPPAGAPGRQERVRNKLPRPGRHHHIMTTPPRGRCPRLDRLDHRPRIDSRRRGIHSPGNSSLTDTRASAEKWRTGLAALVTLVTTALLIKGPENAANIETGWRVALTLMLSAGLVLAVIGLWLALSAASGVPSTVTFDAVVQQYGSVKAFQVAEASAAARQLTHARPLIMASLGLLISGMVIWWWAPETKPDKPVIEVSTVNGTACGHITSADQAAIRLDVAGESAPRVIPFSTIRNLAVAENCPEE